MEVSFHGWVVPNKGCFTGIQGFSSAGENLECPDSREAAAESKEMGEAVEGLEFRI